MYATQTQTADQPLNRGKLPISIAWRAFGYVFRNFGAVVRVGFIPLLLTVSIYALIFIYFPPQAEYINGQPREVPNIPIAIVHMLINILISTMFVVGIHRLAILNERPPSLFYIRFQREEIKYLVTALITVIGFFLLFAIIGGLGYLAVMGVGLQEVADYFQSPEILAFFTSPLGIATGIALYIAIILLVMWPAARLILAFPHAAITGKIDFGLSWRTMRGNYWRYIAAVLIFSLIAIVAYVILIAVVSVAIYGLVQIVPQESVPGAIGQGDSNWQSTVVLSVTIFLFTVIVGFLQAAAITMISMSYQALILRNYETAA